MIIRICYFTKQGERLAERLLTARPDLLGEIRNREESLEDWTHTCFAQRLPILFIGAAGIAVRTIAPFVKDKLVDSAVMVMDEQGRFVIPLLSGHMGSANELAQDIADTLQAVPVLTTATDVEHLFSVDVFARRNSLHIVNREGIRKVSAKLLRGEKIKIFIEETIQVKDERYPDEIEIIKDMELGPDVIIRRSSRWAAEVEQEEKPVEDHLVLETKEFVCGMGCKKDKPYEEVMAFLRSRGILEKESQVCALASIDIKKQERGLLGAAQYLRVPFLTYGVEELAAVPGTFTESAFVQQTTGVSNVCERAAVCCAGEGAQLIVNKVAMDGMTLAVAQKQPQIVTWNTGMEK